ncbi:MAG: BamA/TamA family outer membrane protein, partial [Janthinobacterium lividum]
PVRHLTLAAGLCCSMIATIMAAQAGENPSPPPVAPAAGNQINAPPPSPGPERLEIGAALDSEDGPIGSAYAGRNNLIPGVFAFATLRYARHTQRAQAGLFKPQALGERIDAGVDLDVRRDAYADQGFRATTYGVEPYLRFDARRGGVLTTGLGYRVRTVDDLAADAPPFFRRDAGTRSGVYAHVSHTLDRFVETRRLTLSAGIDNHAYDLNSGNHAVWRTEAWSRAKVALVPGDLSLLDTVRVGFMRPLGGGSPSVADRFFIGGANLRGFAPRRVGPRDGDYFVGGERYVTASLDLIKQVGTVLGSPVSAGVFADVGSLWGGGPRPDTAAGTVANAAASTADTRAIVRASAGIAVTFTVAGMPVSAYVAQPVRKQSRDVAQKFGISISMRF